MPFGLGPSVGLLSVILFVLPGLAGIKLGLQVAKRGDWLSRLETTVLSFALSLTSMVILYFIGSLLSLLSGSRALLSQGAINDWVSTVPRALMIYFLLVVTSLIVGAILGYFDFGRSYLKPTLPWARFHQLAEDEVDDETYAVRIKTSSGDEVRGKMEEEGEAALNKDMVVENPRRLRFNQEGGLADDRKWTGYAYVHSQSVSYVEFDRLEDADATVAQDEKSTSAEGSTEHEADTDSEMNELEGLAGKQDKKDKQDG